MREASLVKRISQAVVADEIRAKRYERRRLARDARAREAICQLARHPTLLDLSIYRLLDCASKSLKHPTVFPPDRQHGYS